MSSNGGRYSDEMLLAFVLWLCSLPLVAIVVIPWIGLPTALGVAAGLFILAMVACWGACGRRIADRRGPKS